MALVLDVNVPHWTVVSEGAYSSWRFEFPSVLQQRSSWRSGR